MSGTGLYAGLVRKRFEVACRRFGLNGKDGAGRRLPGLDCSRFKAPVPPEAPTPQLRLF
jgi:hypothetical protein